MMNYVWVFSQSEMAKYFEWMNEWMNNSNNKKNDDDDDDENRDPLFSL